MEDFRSPALGASALHPRAPAEAQATSRPAIGEDVIQSALAKARRRLINVAAFSGAINILTLSGSLYMLQVYDRVLPSRSLATLAGLSVMVLLAYLLQAYLDAVRARMLARIGGLFDAALQDPIFETITSLPLKGANTAAVMQPLRDLELIRAFLSGMGPTAFLDMPWIPIFVLALFLFHPLIGLTATAGAALIIGTTLLAERQSKKFAQCTVERAAQRTALVEAAARCAEALHALGMRARFGRKWSQLNELYIAEMTRMRDVEADIGAAAKMIRYTLQSAILGIGAALVVTEQASGGIMIASSIMMGRALAPIEIALGTLKQLTSARQALGRLSKSLRETVSLSGPRIGLPRPQKSLSVCNVSVVPPASQRLVVRNVSFELFAGSGLAVIGASGSGKSSLARAIVGIWPPSAGAVEIDGARLALWPADALGQHVGYLPQEIGLFDGTVAENICRFEETASDSQIVEAAVIAGAHNLILSLPEGYSTRIGEAGALLSAGQRQRIGLARAVYRRPFLLVLDEPNANLDAEGEAALARAIAFMRAQRSIVVVISHRPSALAVLDKMLVLHRGAVLAFGSRQEVLDRLKTSDTPSNGELTLDETVQMAR